VSGDYDVMSSFIMFAFEKVLSVCTLHLRLLDFWSVSVILYSKQNVSKTDLFPF